jgi:hypothetical protein
MHIVHWNYLLKARMDAAAAAAAAVDREGRIAGLRPELCGMN